MANTAPIPTLGPSLVVPTSVHDEHNSGSYTSQEEGTRPWRRQSIAIGGEPHRFDHRDLRAIELKHAAQMRQQCVVNDRDEAPHAEQAGQQDNGLPYDAAAPAASATALMFDCPDGPATKYPITG